MSMKMVNSKAKNRAPSSAMASMKKKTRIEAKLFVKKKKPLIVNSHSDLTFVCFHLLRLVYSV